MPLITGECKKCHGRAIFNIGSLSKEAVEAWMAKSEFGECAADGWHVEIGYKADYYDLDWSRSFETIEEAKEYNQVMLDAKLIAIGPNPEQGIRAYLMSKNEEENRNESH